MANNTVYYTIPEGGATVTLENLSANAIKVQMYRANLWEEIPGGDAIAITCDSSEEVIYYQNLALNYGVDEDGIPTVLKVTKSDE